MVLVAQRHDIGDPGRVVEQVQQRDGVVLLQGHPSPHAERADGNVLGLQVLRGRRTRPVDAHPLVDQLLFVAVLGREIDRARGIRNAMVEVDDADRALGIDEGVAGAFYPALRLAFVGDQELVAERAESEHVRADADRELLR